ncbi:hypothetical protein HHL17_23195 [Chitinophaga sp. G-6-1-13]|uniref:Uncharacterized protein n=1 Tax=Chitinophaga fulva TaxID=2728842 RepID=A0A848GNZ4_9BACT|nr:hypothetical protein [Chitinophaga fulva]NML40124.1 hypothetical protein [Chitinophaga fulva]
MIVVVLWRLFFKRVTPADDIPPAPMPVYTPTRSLIQPVDQELFLAQLKQVVTAIELLMKDTPDGRWDYRAMFRRSSNIDNPPAFLPERGVIYWELDIFHEPEEIRLALAAVVKGRTGVSPASWEDILQKGKIVAHEIDKTLIDGGCEVVSNGYVDVYDLPPIDTWIYLTSPEGKVDPILYCWVPNQFVKTMQDVIDVSIADLFEWTDVVQLLPNHHP